MERTAKNAYLYLLILILAAASIWMINPIKINHITNQSVLVNYDGMVAKSTASRGNISAGQKPVPPSIIFPPKAVSKILPAYPEDAIIANHQGKVLIGALIAPNGEIRQVKISQSCGFAELDLAAANVISKWIFTPANNCGQNISAWLKIPFYFKLKNQGE